MTQSRHKPPPRQREPTKHPIIIIKVVKGFKVITWGPPTLHIPCYSVILSSEEDDFTNTVTLRQFTGDLAQERSEAWKQKHETEFMNISIRELWERFKQKKPEKKKWTFLKWLIKIIPFTNQSHPREVFPEKPWPEPPKGAKP